MDLESVDTAEREKSVVGDVGCFVAPFEKRVVFAGKPGDEGHGWGPEDMAEVYGNGGVEFGGGGVEVSVCTCEGDQAQDQKDKKLHLA